MEKERQIDCDLLIIGSGLSGMSAAYFAVKSGLSAVQVSNHATLNFHSGLLDVAAVTPSTEAISWDNPLSALEEIKKISANHPYSKIDETILADSMNQVISFLKQEGLDYSGSLDRNVPVLTSMGLARKSCFIPSTMRAGVDAYTNRKQTLIVDIKGLRGFSGNQIIETAKEKWPNLDTISIDFPGLEQRREISSEHMARALENEKNLLKFIERIEPHIKAAAAIGLPPILGVHNTREILETISAKLGVSVFEIPSMPPSIPGLRLKETFERGLQKLGVQQFFRQLIGKVERGRDGLFHTGWDKSTGSVRIRSKGVILATGRFLGKGLVLDNNAVKETLFNLPIAQPEPQQKLYEFSFFNSKGHGINRAGIETDFNFRPLRMDSKLVYDNLFSVGIINAHQDWAREKSGSGIAISSAYKAVQSFISAPEKNGLSQRAM